MTRLPPYWTLTPKSRPPKRTSEYGAGRTWKNVARANSKIVGYHEGVRMERKSSSCAAATFSAKPVGRVGCIVDPAATHANAPYVDRTWGNRERHGPVKKLRCSLLEEVRIAAPFCREPIPLVLMVAVAHRTSFAVGKEWFVRQHPSNGTYCVCRCRHWNCTLRGLVFF